VDAIDQLAWTAAQDVLEFEERMPGQQDPAVLWAAVQVLRILSSELKSDSDTAGLQRVRTMAAGGAQPKSHS